MSVITADNDGLPVASTAEAEAGVVDNKTMTPLKTKQAIDYALSSSAVEILEGTVVWEPSSTTGVALSPNINVTGSALGDFVDVAPPYDVQGMLFTGYVSDANTVNIALTNLTGSTINLASGTWKVRVLPSVIVSPGAEVGATVPSALGTAAAGTSIQAARADHVHAMPTANQVGAAPIGHTHAVSDTTGLQAILDGKADLTHTQAASTITDLSEAIDDRVNALMVAGQNMALAYNDVANTLTVSTTAANVSSTAPAPLGVAAAGTSVDAARADHVHAMPTAEQLGVAPAVHTHTASNVSDFGEAVDDRVAALLVEGSQIGIAYDDAANTLTISSSAPALSSTTPQPLGTAAAGSASTAARSDHVHAMPAVTDITGFAEAVDDRVATLVQAGAGVNITYNDAANTLTVSAAGGSAQLGTSTPAPLGTASAGSGENASREDHVHSMPTAADVGAAATVHTHTASQVTDFAEAVDDRVNALLVQGANVTLTYDDTANTLTIASSGGTVGTATPQALGTAAAGTSLFSSREDHVHAMPTAVQVGAAPAVHTHAIADTTGLQAALDGKADDAHTHVIDDVTGLQAALDGKADDAHTHAIADTTGLQAALDGKAASAHTHTASNVSDFAEAVDDRVNALLVQGTNMTLTYDDGANTLTVATTAAAVSSSTPAPLGTAAAGSATNASRADHVHAMPTHTDVGAAAAVHTHVATDITDLNETIDDRVGAIIVGGSGSGITTTYDDGAATLTIGTNATTAATADTLVKRDSTGRILHIPYVLYQNNVASSKSDANTTETTIGTYTIPAGTMGVNDSLRITTRWSVPATATLKHLRVKIGTSVLVFNSTTTNNLSFTNMAMISNRNSLTSQIGMASANNPWSVLNTALSTFTIDFSQAQTLTATAQWASAGDGSANITLESIMVEYLPG